MEGSVYRSSDRSSPFHLDDTLDLTSLYPSSVPCLSITEVLLDCSSRGSVVSTPRVGTSVPVLRLDSYPSFYRGQGDPESSESGPQDPKSSENVRIHSFSLVTDSWAHGLTQKEQVFLSLGTQDPVRLPRRIGDLLSWTRTVHPSTPECRPKGKTS